MADDLVVTLRLAGGRAFIVQNAEAAASVKGVGDAAEVAGKKSAFAAERNFLFGESMYSLRRYAFYGITALGLTGAAVLKMGFDFDEAKSKGVDALESLVGGSRAARTEVARLVSLTHTSGIDLSSLVSATQTMLTFGFSVQQTNAYLEAFANFSGVKGLGATGIETLSELFNRVQGQGFLSGRQLAQLTSLGIPGTKLLTEALHLSPADQYSLIHGQGQVPASVALPAIAEWLNAYAKRQPKTLGQQFEIGKSYLAQITGTLGTPVFNWLDSLAPSLNRTLGRVSAAGEKGGIKGMLAALDPSLTLLHGWQTLTNLLKIAAGTLRSVWEVARPFVAVLALVTSGVLALTTHLGFLRLVLNPLIALYIVSRTQLVLLWAAQKAVAVILGVVRGALILWTLAVKTATAAQWLFNAALDANPIALIVLGVAALAVGIYLLYTRVGWFRTAVNLLWHDLKYTAPLVAGALTLAFGPIGLAVTGLLLIIRYWKEITGFFGSHQLSASELLKQQGSLASTFGVSNVVKSDLAQHITVAQLEKAHAPQAVIDAMEKAVRSGMSGAKLSLHGDGGKKIADVTFAAKQKAQARR